MRQGEFNKELLEVVTKLIEQAVQRSPTDYELANIKEHADHLLMRLPVERDPPIDN